MKPLTSALLATTTAGALWLGTTRVHAQDDAPPPPPPNVSAPASSPGANGAPGAPGGNREEGRERFRQQMNERLKMMLKASDDEWAVISPLLDNVQAKTRETIESRFNGMRGLGGGPGGPGGGGPRGAGGNNGGGANGGNAPDAARAEGNRPRPQGRGPTPEAKALTETLQNDNSSTNDIKTKLAALREQRKKSEADLAAARDDLKKVLTLRQEAILVSAGMLD